MNRNYAPIILNNAEAIHQTGVRYLIEEKRNLSRASFALANCLKLWRELLFRLRCSDYSSSDRNAFLCLDDFRLDIARSLLITRMLDGVPATALRHGLQVCSIVCHLRCRNFRLMTDPSSSVSIPMMRPLLLFMSPMISPCFSSGI